MELVDVRSAGVVFTLDPVTGDRDRMVVEANWGFGESVVSGQVTPDYWAAAPAAVPAPAPAANAQPAPTAQPSFNPVQYALRNVFKVPGT